MSVLRRYPDFFIVGAQRCGTTSLYESLRVHPQIRMSAHKEPHYFSQDRVRLDADQVVRSEAAYLDLFAGATDGQLCGEASPSYLWHPDAAERIYARQPRAKIIVLLRDPIERAFSQYLMDLADGMSPSSFYDAIQRATTARDKVYGTGESYVELGMYAEQVTRYVRVFSRERVLLLKFKDLAEDPMTLLKHVAAFLEIDAGAFGEGALQVENQTVTPRHAVLQHVLKHRSARQVYRALVPGKIRRAVRAQVFVRSAPALPEPEAVDFLRSVYLPDRRTFLARFGDYYALSG